MSTWYQAFTRLWRQGGKQHQHSTEELVVTSSKGMETKAIVKASPPGQRLPWLHSGRRPELWTLTVMCSHVDNSPCCGQQSTGRVYECRYWPQYLAYSRDILYTRRTELLNSSWSPLLPQPSLSSPLLCSLLLSSFSSFRIVPRKVSFHVLFPPTSSKNLHVALYQSV